MEEKVKNCKTCEWCIILDVRKEFVLMDDYEELKKIIQRYGFCQEFHTLVLLKRKACKYYEG